MLKPYKSHKPALISRHFSEAIKYSSFYRGQTLSFLIASKNAYDDNNNAEGPDYEFNDGNSNYEDANRSFNRDGNLKTTTNFPELFDFFLTPGYEEIITARSEIRQQHKTIISNQQAFAMRTRAYEQHNKS